MSIDKEFEEKLNNFAKEINEEADKYSDLPETNTSIVHKNDALDLSGLFNNYNEELKALKEYRRALVERRAHIDKSIGIIDKRISVNLGALQVLSTPSITSHNEDEATIIEG